MNGLSDSALKLSILGIHCFQWISDVIVMGISAYFISKYDRGQHTTYDIVISTIGVVFHLPGLISPFVTSLSWISLPMDLIWSYLYITGFVFAGEDYNWLSCSLNGPPGASCSKKRGMEAFLFFGFFFSMVGAICETMRMYQRKGADASTYPASPAPAPAPAPAAAPAPAPVSAPAPSANPDSHSKETV